MTIFDFYNSIMTDIQSYLKFLGFLILMCIVFCIMIGFIVGQICTIIAYWRVGNITTISKKANGEIVD